MTRTGNPASTMTMRPEAAIRSDVPRSGCNAISNTGTAINTASTRSCPALGGSERSCRYHAAIIGTASFMISDG